MVFVWIIVGVAAALFLALELAPVWLRAVDRAPGNDRLLLASEYEAPRYFVRSPDGRVDTAARWPGWDAWGVCALPDDSSLPPHMIRGSLMTGLFGLEGVDNYEKLDFRLSSYDAVEHLCLVPTTYTMADGETVILDNLSQYYLTREIDLEMADSGLDVTVVGSRVGNEVTDVAYSHISGAWPRYQADLRGPESELLASLDYQGRRIVWWTDLPGFYTHYTVFGEFAVNMVYERGTVIADPHTLSRNPAKLSFPARGTVEHISAVRPRGLGWLSVLLRHLGGVLYHHEVLVGEEIEGGFVHARVFGVDFRNRGGLFAGEDYHELRRVSVKYTASDLVDNCGGRGAPVPVWRQWDVLAASDSGPLLYSATRTHPPAMVAANTSQYHFTWEGTWCGRPVRGRGYGEFARL